MNITTRLALAGALSLGLGSGVNAAENIKMATIAPGSSAYLVMTTMANIVNNAQDDYEVSVDATGAATKHMVEAAQGKLDVVMSSPVIYHLMKAGKAMYSKLSAAPELSENLNLLFWFPYGAYHVVTYADSGINTLADLKGKKVFLGPPGGGAWNTSKAWLEANTGMVPGDDYENVKASWGAALQGFQDRQFDAYITGGIAPFPQVEQLALTAKLKLIGLTKAEFDAAPEAVKKETSKLGRSLEVIKPGTYGDGVVNSDDVYTVGATGGVVARADLSGDAVYAMTKAFWEGLPDVRKTAPYMDQVTLDGALTSPNIKLHPGALKYYKEIGLEIPAEMM